MIPGGTELVLVTAVFALLVAGPKLVPAIIGRGAETIEATRTAVDGADGGETGGGR